VLVYLDGGCELNLAPSRARLRFTQYVEFARDNGFLAMETPQLAKMWTKRDTFNAVLGGDPDPWARQREACILVIANTPLSRELLKAWCHYSTIDDYHLLDDSPSVLTEDPLFIEHRHDQAILSLLLVGGDVAPFPYESFFGADASATVRDWIAVNDSPEARSLVGSPKDWYRTEYSSLVSSNQRTFIEDIDRWRSSGHDYPFWASRNGSLWPLYSGGAAGKLTRRVRHFSRIVLNSTRERLKW